MPVMMNSFLLPISPALPFLLEDKLIKGGMQCLENASEMNNMHVAKRKVGMLVSISSEGGKTYKLQADKKTWEEANFGGGSGADLVFEAPITTVLSPTGQTVIGLSQGQRIPEPPGAGYVLASGGGDTLLWIDMFGDANVGVRRTFKYTCGTFLKPGDTHDFLLQSSNTILLVLVKMNVFDVKLEGFSMEDRSDRNPYTFISGLDAQTDEGVFFDGEVQRNLRRYSVLATPVPDGRHYMRFSNVGTSPCKPTLDMTYLILE